MSRISVMVLSGCPDYNCTMGELEMAISKSVEGIWQINKNLSQMKKSV